MNGFQIRGRATKARIRKAKKTKSFTPAKTPRCFKGNHCLHEGSKTKVLYEWLVKHSVKGVWSGSQGSAMKHFGWSFKSVEGAFRRLRERGLIESGLGAGHTASDEPFWEVK